MTAPEDVPAADSRWVQCAGVDNVRDLGGLPALGDRRTRRGVAFRASALEQASSADAKLLVDGLGIRVVIDLRRPEEVRHNPAGLLAESRIRWLNLPVGNPGPKGRFSTLVLDGRLADLVSIYFKFLADSAESIVEAVRILAHADEHPVLFHCAAGKDRTGVLAGLILDAAGVSANVVAHDYGLTTSRMDRIRSRLSASDQYQHVPMVDARWFRADPVTMQTFLAQLHDEYGGAAEWLLAHGLAETELARLQSVLVEPGNSAQTSLRP